MQSLVKSGLLSSSLPMQSTKELVCRPESPGEIIVHNEASIGSQHNDERSTPHPMTDVPLSSSSSSPSSPLSPGRVISPSEHSAVNIDHYPAVSAKYKGKLSILSMTTPPTDVISSRVGSHIEDTTISSCFNVKSDW